MEKAVILKHLEALQRLAFRGDGLIEAQRQIIASLRASGANTRAAQRIIDEMEEAQKHQLAEINSLRDALVDSC